MIAPGKLKRKTPGSGAGPSVGFAVRYRKKNRNLTSFMPLPRKQIMNGNEVSSTWVMISLTHFKAERKGDLIVIISQEIIPCPVSVNSGRDPFFHPCRMQERYVAALL